MPARRSKYLVVSISLNGEEVASPAWDPARVLPTVLLRIACKTVEVVGSLNVSQWRRICRKFSHVILGLRVLNLPNTVRIRSLLQRRLLAVSDFSLMSAILQIGLWDIVACSSRVSIFPCSWSIAAWAISCSSCISSFTYFGNLASKDLHTPRRSNSFAVNGST